MYVSGNFSPIDPMRRFLVGATVVAGQVVCVDNSNNYAEVGAPSSVNDGSEQIGITEDAATYTATQGSAYASTLVHYSPLVLYTGRCWGGVTAGTALATATDGNILANDSASAGGTTVTETAVGTSEFVTGWLVGLSGANKGSARIISTHTDNTSTAVTPAFSSAIAVGDTFLRAFGTGNQGLEFCTDFTSFNMKPGAGVDLPDTGTNIVINMYVDESLLPGIGKVSGADSSINIISATAPVVEAECIAADHAFNSLA